MSEIKRAVKLAELLIAKRKDVESLEQQLSLAKSDLQRIEQDDLPDLMMELELTTFTLSNGASVEVLQDVQCGISEERRRAAHDWLINNKFCGLIKTEVSVAFDRGGYEEAQRTAEQIGGSVKETVHPSTLKSFIKEQLAAGAPVPFELFGVRPFNRVKITLKK